MKVQVANRSLCRRGVGIWVFVALWGLLPPGCVQAESWFPAGRNNDRPFGPDRSRRFTFAVVGDTRSEQHIVQPEVFKQIIRDVNELSPTFIINLGDLILGGNPALAEKEWDEYFRVVSRARAPFVSILGNHDVWNPASAGLWLRRLGHRYFSFTHGRCRFICLDTDEHGPGRVQWIEGPQLAWLKDQLARARKADHIFILLHRPLWSEGKNWMKVIHPVLSAFRNVTVIAGHAHRFQQRTLKGSLGSVKYIISGGGGAALHGKSRDVDKFHHYLLVHVNGRQVDIEVREPRSYARLPRVRHLKPLVPLHATWRYLDEGPPPPEDWMKPEFDDSAWKTGRAELGYGDKDEKTLLKFGPDEKKKRIAYYFRLTFEAQAPAAKDKLFLRARYDDGVVFYLNGKPLQAAGLKPFPKFNQLAASRKNENAIEEWPGLPTKLLRPGRNVLAAEVHQTLPTSSDISFDAALTIEDMAQCDRNAILRGPYVQNLGTTGATITWQTAQPAGTALDISPGKGVRQWVRTPGNRCWHEVALADLNPNTQYRVVAVSASPAHTVKSGALTFRTLPPSQDRTRFVVLGDSRSRPKIFAKVCAEVLTHHRANPVDFILHTGDLVADGRVYPQWGRQFFVPADKLLKTIPFYPVFGNHERSSIFYKTFYALPGNEHWYSFDRGPVHVVALDSNRSLTPEGRQYQWLVRDLARSKAPWKILVCHHPVWTSAGHGKLGKDGRPVQKPIRDLQDHIVPLCRKMGVRLIFSGHSHAYERSEKDGLINITSGGAGAPLYQKIKPPVNPHSKIYLPVLHFCKIEATPDKLVCRALDLSGKQIDRFTLLPPRATPAEK